MTPSSVPSRQPSVDVQFGNAPSPGETAAAEGHFPIYPSETELLAQPSSPPDPHPQVPETAQELFVGSSLPRSSSKNLVKLVLQSPDGSEPMVDSQSVEPTTRWASFSFHRPGAGWKSGAYSLQLMMGERKLAASTLNFSKPGAATPQPRPEAPPEPQASSPRPEAPPEPQASSPRPVATPDSASPSSGEWGPRIVLSDTANAKTSKLKMPVSVPEIYLKVSCPENFKDVPLQVTWFKLAGEKRKSQVLLDVHSKLADNDAASITFNLHLARGFESGSYAAELRVKDALVYHQDFELESPPSP